MIRRFLLISLLVVAAWRANLAMSQAPAASPEGATMKRIAGLAMDLHRNVLYVADQGSSSIFRVENGGGLKLLAGTGSNGFNGDGKSALETQFNHPLAISFDQRTGELFVADTRNYRIRTISPTDSRVRTVAGTGISTPIRQIPYDSHTPAALAAGRFSGDGGPAIRAELNLPSGVCADPVGILFIADSGNHRVRAVNRGTSPVIVMGVEIGPGEIQTIAGNGILGFSGDDGKANLAQLAFPTELKVDASGDLLVVDSFNQRIRMIDRQSGLIHTLVKGTISEVPPDRALLQWATSAVGVAVTMTQDVIYTDRVDNSVHRLSRSGEDQVLYRTQPHVAEFAGVEVGPDGQIYVVDVHWNRVVLVSGGTLESYIGGAPGPVLSFPGTKSVSGRRRE